MAVTQLQSFDPEASPSMKPLPLNSQVTNISNIKSKAKLRQAPEIEYEMTGKFLPITSYVKQYNQKNGTGQQLIVFLA